jgi:HD-GYP domain-containing protein (c-di-GMP phosphodiesterase class II)
VVSTAAPVGGATKEVAAVIGRDKSSALQDTLSGHLRFLHERLAIIAPEVERIACALYDPDEDMLKTFINSTQNGYAIRGYQYRLSDSQSLSHLARSNETRVIVDIPGSLTMENAHSRYVLEEGYLSSFTVPMRSGGAFLGMIFFDSRVHSTFTPELQRELTLYAQLMTAEVASEFVAIRSIIGTIQVARDLTELRDVETGAHLERMARYSRIIARGLIEPLDLDDEFVEAVFLYAPLHDVGKIGIPDRILLKPGKLDADEWEIMQSHTVKGRRMVDTISRDLGIGALSREDVMCNIVELHHETLDGSGYPYGLEGDAIPLEARIVSVADIFDALTSARPYKTGWAIDRAFEELDRLVDLGRLDPRCLGALASQPSEVESVLQRHAEDVARATVEGG